MSKPIRDPSIPYIGPIYGGRFSPGTLLRIQGTLPSVAYRFDINLQCGPQTIHRDDIAMQVAVHVLDGYISTNSLRDGIWGEEQRGAVPIKRAAEFEIIIACEFNQYKVAVNGQYYCAFPQRIHYDRISHLAIEGDVSIVQISYEQGAGDGFCGSSATTAPIAQRDDFEIINPNAPAPHSVGFNPAPDIGFSPPSYETATQAPKPAGAPYPSTNAPYPTNTTGGAPYPTTTAAPYPTTTAAPYPTTTAAPYPTTTAPYPTSSPAPYPTSSPAPYPTSSPYPVNAGYPVTQTVVPLNAQPLTATVPLNADGSYFRQSNRVKIQRWAAGCCGFFLVAVIIIAAVMVKSIKHSSHRSSSSNYH